MINSRLHLSPDDVSTPLLQVFAENNLQFMWYVVMDYHFKQKSLDVSKQDNEHFRRSFRRYFKSDIRMLFTNEFHRGDPKSPNFMGYHRNGLIEDPFAGEDLSSIEKIQKLTQVIRKLNRRIPNGYKGLSITPITENQGGIKGLVQYVTKDSWKHDEYLGDVVHHECSDFINKSLLDKIHEKYKVPTLTRSKRILNRQDRALRLASIK